MMLVELSSEGRVAHVLLDGDIRNYRSLSLRPAFDD